jgi:hypothetical protein
VVAPLNYRMTSQIRVCLGRIPRFHHSIAHLGLRKPTS